MITVSSGSRAGILLVGLASYGYGPARALRESRETDNVRWGFRTHAEVNRRQCARSVLHVNFGNAEWTHYQTCNPSRFGLGSCHPAIAGQ